MRGKTWYKINKYKKLMPAVIICALLVCALIIGTSSKSLMAAVLKRELPIYCVEKDSKIVSLTFDAAWGNEDTQALIDILGKYGIKATFFVVGDWAEKYPESVKALCDAGHEVMNHSDTHPHMNKLTEEQIKDQLSKCNEKIEAITGTCPILFRAPYGEYCDKVIKTARSMGMYTIQWDVDSLDWKDLSADQICQRVLEKVKPGSIILFHNAAKNTPEALPKIIAGLIQKGYGFSKASDLIMRDNYDIDHSGKQIKVKDYIQ